MVKNPLRWPWAPFFFGIFPFLHLYSVNTVFVDKATLVRPLLVVCLSTLLIVAVAWLLVRRPAMAAILASIFIFSFTVFSGAQAYWLAWMDDTAFALAARVGVGVCACAMTVVAFFALRRTPDLFRWMPAFNAAAAVLLLLPLIQTVSSVRHKRRQTVAPREAAGPVDPSMPNIYYLVLDGYAREDVLRDYFGYDNSGFTRFLEGHGFYVAPQSTSNYAYTLLSLASTLNMGFLDDINDRQDQMPECLVRIRDNSVFRLFRKHGYFLVHFASGWFTDNNPSADRMINSPSSDEFDLLLWRSLPLGLLMNHKAINSRKSRLLSTLQGLGALDTSSRPTFVFAHIICPHPPFVFDRQGRTPPPKTYGPRPPGSRDWYPKERYLDQLVFLTGEVEKTILGIQKNAKRPTIILVQSDHGPACDGTSAHPNAMLIRERMSVLDAFYVPPDIRARLYPTMTPVNSFRILSSSLFHTRLRLMPDRNYYSGPMDALPYHFLDVTARIAAQR